MSARALIVGAAGQLGTELARCLRAMEAEMGPVPGFWAGAAVDAADLPELDISDAASVGAWFSAHGPYDAVFNCAAMTNVDGCEAAEAAALKANAVGPMLLARACAASGAKLVHVSTDYVFPGTEPGARAEGDPVGPISAYGRSKLAGELLAADACPSTFVVRTAWLYGYKGGNFVKTMLRLARERGAISVVADQLGCPTNANDLALELLALTAGDAYGTYHCVGAGECSWFDLASAAVEMAGVPCEREPLTSAEYKRRFPASADRPAHSALDCSKLAATTGIPMRPWREALASYLRLLPELGE